MMYKKKIIKEKIDQQLLKDKNGLNQNIKFLESNLLIIFYFVHNLLINIINIKQITNEINNL